MCNTIHILSINHDRPLESSVEMDVGETKEKYLYIVNENNANSIHSSNLMLAGILNGRWMVHRGKFLQTHRRSPLWNKDQ